MEDPLKTYNDVLKISGGENIDKRIYELLKEIKEQGEKDVNDEMLGYFVDDARRAVKDAELLGLVVVDDSGWVHLTPEGVATLERNSDHGFNDISSMRTYISSYGEDPEFDNRWKHTRRDAIIGMPTYGEAVANEVPYSGGHGSTWTWTCPNCKQLIQYDENFTGLIFDHLRSHGYSDLLIRALLNVDLDNKMRMDSVIGESVANEVEIDEYDKDDIFQFLFDLRDSGVTNMFGAGSYVKEAFPLLTRKQVQEVVLEWMDNFEELRQRMGIESYASEEDGTDFDSDGDIDSEDYLEAKDRAIKKSIDEESYASEDVFTCPRCGFKTSSDDKMQYHMEDHDDSDYLWREAEAEFANYTDKDYERLGLKWNSDHTELVNLDGSPVSESYASEDSYYIDDQKQYYNGKPYPSQASYIDHEIQGHFRPENYEEAERKTGDGYIYGNWDRIVCNHCGIHLNYDQGIAHLLNSHDTTTNANQAGYTNFYGGNDDNNWSGTFMPSGISGF